jgi:hypothetical protein
MLGEPIDWQSIGKVFCSVLICEGERKKKGKEKAENKSQSGKGMRISKKKNM